MLSFSRTLACAFALLVSPSFAATQIYTYRDDSGTQSFTTELDSIPEQYRSRVILLTSDRGSPVGGEHANSPPNLARNDIRSYTAGVVTVVNQQITARLDGETVVIRVDLTAKSGSQSSDAGHRSVPRHWERLART